MRDASNSSQTFDQVDVILRRAGFAADGLRYTNFHSTSLCSPTRAALITGRNHHSVGFGVISEAGDRLPRL